MEAVIFIGIQGSGKTTFYMQRFFQTHVRLSLDMLKTRRRERFLLECCIRAKQPFVMDFAWSQQEKECLSPASLEITESKSEP